MGIVFDTYALLAWFRDGKEEYRPYFESGDDKFITLLILMEFYFFLYHFSGKPKADRFRKILLMNFRVLQATEESVVAAAVMRSKMMRQRKRMSYTDCLAYVLAVGSGHKVLTGDEHFRGLDPELLSLWSPAMLAKLQGQSVFANPFLTNYLSSA